MNKILKVLALGAMALSTTACSDFLEVNPRTQVSEPNSIRRKTI